MKKFILLALMCFALTTGTVVMASLASQPAQAGCGCGP